MANPIVDYILGFKAAEWRIVSDDTLSATVDGDVPVALYRQGSAKRLIVGNPGGGWSDHLDIYGEPGAAAGDALAELWAHAEEQVRPKPEERTERLSADALIDRLHRLFGGNPDWAKLLTALAEERTEDAERIASLEAKLAAAEDRAERAVRHASGWRRSFDAASNRTALLVAAISAAIDTYEAGGEP